MNHIFEILVALVLFAILARGVLALMLASQFVKAGTGNGAIRSAFAHFARQSITDTYLFAMTGLPLSVNGTTQLSKFVDTRNAEFVDFFVYVGANASTVDAKAQESVNADGSAASDIAGAAITQIAVANQMAVISVKKSTLTKRYAGVLVTVGAGAAVVAQSAVAYGVVGNLPVAQQAAGSNSYATAQVVKV